MLPAAVSELTRTRGCPAAKATSRRTYSSLSNAASAAPPSSVDRVLFNDLVELVPLVQSLIDPKANTLFTHRGSIIYTKTPSRVFLLKKVIEVKRSNVAQSIATKKHRDPGDKEQNRNTSNNPDSGADGFSMSTRYMLSEKDMEELSALRQQVEELQQKLSEKDELLKSAKISKDEMASVHAKLDEVKHQSAERDSLLKSTQSQLSDTEIKLADKQSAVEKLQWEAMTSNKRVEKLREDLNTMQGEISSFMLLFEGLSKNGTALNAVNHDITPFYSEHLSLILIDVLVFASASLQTEVPKLVCQDDLNEIEMQKMEEAREAYVVAVAAAKEKQDEESIAAAARTRFHLQSLVMESSSINGSLQNVEISRSGFISSQLLWNPVV